VGNKLQFIVKFVHPAPLHYSTYKYALHSVTHRKTIYLKVGFHNIQI